MYFSYGPEISYKKLTASGVVGDSGKAQCLYAYSFKSDGTAGVLNWFDGTSSLGTQVFDHSGTVNITVFGFPSVGLLFPLGLYASFDTHVTQVTAWYRQVLT